MCTAMMSAAPILMFFFVCLLYPACAAATAAVTIAIADPAILQISLSTLLRNTYGDLETLVGEDERSVSGGKIAVHCCKVCRCNNVYVDVFCILVRGVVMQSVGILVRMLFVSLSMCVLRRDQLTRKPF